MKVGLITSENTQDLTPEDQRLCRILNKNGIKAEPAVWSRKNINWKIFDSLIIRSCWDYHYKIDDFLNWLLEIEELDIPVFNSTATIRKNMNKNYLQSFDEKGYKLIPTLWYDSQERPNIRQIMEKQKWENVVLKPTVGATAFKTVKMDKTAATDFQWSKNIDYPNGFMIQKYIQQIETHGEWSIIFFGKNYSHSVLKRSQSGDFRVQSKFGGKYKQTQPDSAIIQQAETILSAYNEYLLYARVDGIQVNSEFYLMEVELIEPQLFLMNEEIAKRLADEFKRIAGF